MSTSTLLYRPQVRTGLLASGVLPEGSPLSLTEEHHVVGGSGVQEARPGGLLRLSWFKDTRGASWLLPLMDVAVAA